MRKLLALLLFQFLFALSSLAQTTIDGRTAYYDTNTESYLMSVPEDYEIDSTSMGGVIFHYNLPICR